MSSCYKDLCPSPVQNNFSFQIIHSIQYFHSINHNTRLSDQITPIPKPTTINMQLTKIFFFAILSVTGLAAPVDADISTQALAPNGIEVPCDQNCQLQRQRDEQQKQQREREERERREREERLRHNQGCDRACEVHHITIPSSVINY